MSKNLSPAVKLTPKQEEQRRLVAAQELQVGEKTQTQIAEDHGVTPPVIALVSDESFALFLNQINSL